jgi:streptogramin lyase
MNGGGLGRIGTDGKVTEYGDGTSSATWPDGIAVGPDGALWYTERKAERIGRLVPSEAVPRVRTMKVVTATAARAGRPVTLRITVSDAARVTVSVRTPKGGTAIEVLGASARAGTLTLRWNGRLKGAVPAPGRYAVVVRATGGGVTLSRTLTLRLTR